MVWCRWRGAENRMFISPRADVLVPYSRFLEQLGRRSDLSRATPEDAHPGRRREPPARGAGDERPAVWGGDTRSVTNKEPTT